MADDPFRTDKIRKNPLVPIGAAVTAGVLIAGLVAFRSGKSQLSQGLMRARVVTQGATVALMLGTATAVGVESSSSGERSSSGSSGGGGSGSSAASQGRVGLFPSSAGASGTSAGSSS